MERCTHCYKPITDEPVMLERLTAKATYLSPEEYDSFPFHSSCADYVQSKAYADYCDEMRSLKGYSPEDIAEKY